MRCIDINCDLGEGMTNDTLIMPFISSANIACGYHAGNRDIMQNTVELCIAHKVAIGAHPSFEDKENFGRTEMDLPMEEIYGIVTEQVYMLDNLARKQGAKLHHVKPHGALYNMSARNAELANTIAQAIKDVNEKLILFGLSGSVSIEEAKDIGLKTLSEVFADRTYRDDGSLTPRAEPNALIEDEALAVQQALRMVQKGEVITTSGKRIPIAAETICIHGDGKEAVEFATAIYKYLQQNDIGIKTI